MSTFKRQMKRQDKAEDVVEKVEYVKRMWDDAEASVPTDQRDDGWQQRRRDALAQVRGRPKTRTRRRR